MRVKRNHRYEAACKLGSVANTVFLPVLSFVEGGAQCRLGLGFARPTDNSHLTVHKFGAGPVSSLSLSRHVVALQHPTPTPRRDLWDLASPPTQARGAVASLHFPGGVPSVCAASLTSFSCRLPTRLLSSAAPPLAEVSLPLGAHCSCLCCPMSLHGGHLLLLMGC